MVVIRCPVANPAARCRHPRQTVTVRCVNALPGTVASTFQLYSLGVVLPVFPRTFMTPCSQLPRTLRHSPFGSTVVRFKVLHSNKSSSDAVLSGEEQAKLTLLERAAEKKFSNRNYLLILTPQVRRPGGQSGGCAAAGPAAAAPAFPSMYQAPNLAHISGAAGASAVRHSGV